jgi:hypothetical protein
MIERAGRWRSGPAIGAAVADSETAYEQEEKNTGREAPEEIAVHGGSRCPHCHVAWLKMREKPAGIVTVALAVESSAVPASGDDETV